MPTDARTTGRLETTIVVCTYNRAEMLRDALRSLSKLRVPDGTTMEILVVDNASTDHTPQVVAEIATRTPLPMRLVREARQGVVFARNRGVAEAAGEWIAFFDDDQLADENWLVELHRAARKKGVHSVGGAVRLHFPDGTNRRLSPVCRMLLGETVGRNSPRFYDHRFTPGTGNLMVHRSVFEQVGLFNPEFTDRGEDTDLFLRMSAAGIDAWYTPTAVVHHVTPPERLTDESLLRLSRMTAVGMAEDERQAVGRWRYPIVWCARLAQAFGLLLPKRLWAVIRRDAEDSLGARCRWMIARQRLRDGLRLMRRADS